MFICCFDNHFNQTIQSDDQDNENNSVQHTSNMADSDRVFCEKCLLKLEWKILKVGRGW